MLAASSVTINQQDAHCRSGKRSGILWFELVCIGAKWAVPSDLLRAIHRLVSAATLAEREGRDIYNDRRERESKARLEHGADPALPFFRTLGFACIDSWIAQRRMERHYMDGLRLSRLNASLPKWRAFGFQSVEAYERATAQRNACDPE
jgi:hypothetical protein